MSKSEENQPVEAVYGTPLLQTATVVPSHEGEDGMGSRPTLQQRWVRPVKVASFAQFVL
jgi:hypothetical protein